MLCTRAFTKLARGVTFREPAVRFSSLPPMREHRGKLCVEVTSAEPLLKKHEEALRGALQKFVSPGKKIHVIYSTKPSILGGLIVSIDDKYVDLSMASRVKKLAGLMESAI